MTELGQASRGCWFWRATLLAVLQGSLVLGCSGKTAADGNEGPDGGIADAGEMGAGAMGAAGTIGGSGSGAAGGNGASHAGGAGGMDPWHDEQCVDGIPATSQVARISNRVYDNIVFDLLGLETLEDGSRPSDLLLADFDGAQNAYSWDAYLRVGERIAKQVMNGPLRDNFILCEPEAEGCLEETVRAFGRLAFRRPMTEEEVGRFVALAETDPPGPPELVAETALWSFLVSPSFLQIGEFGTEQVQASYALTSHEIAVRLSLALWGSVPDAELNAAADRDELSDPQAISAHAERMLEIRDKAGRQMAWLLRSYAHVDGSSSRFWWNTPDPARYPEYSADTARAIAAELDAFFEEVVFSGGSFAELFLSPVGFVNEDTASSTTWRETLGLS